MKGHYEGGSYVVVKDGKEYRFATEEEAYEYFENDTDDEDAD